ncbi:15-hydroxyprostaglandin dehydrogenase [NAD(+)] [Exaiptasia diaphana]|uniref:15-hydroxyprostaglandin dehydrogenase [NAD(+)] n=1 Tax=Exaiptasia diaphana TaxID=2652724 RepID=A0A913XW87_EXADI|nr:15-hydroxyprostaglandin dehydrogenase [NAD(+)] [Exaiptasia diaphana]KXJ24289.1 15-hydroxyprostaglandin dehydrogenase [NAD(+)] [Exaiptasia diaphana]
MQIKGAVALVTGAAKGIGYAFSEALLEHGAASVRMLDISKQEGQKAQQQLESKYGSGRAQFDECDVTSKDDLTRCVKSVITDHGKLDILCNNAGIVDEKNWERTIAINLNAVIQGTFLGMEVMNSGVIVNTGSMGGLAPMSLTPTYCASKHGVVGFTRSIAPVAMKTKSIRVNAICPAFVETPLLEKQKVDFPMAAGLVNHLGTVTSDFVAKGLIDIITDDKRIGDIMSITAPDKMTYHQSAISGF